MNNDFNFTGGLKPLTGGYTFNFATWDVESRNWWELQMIGMYDGERYYHWKGADSDIDAFLNFVLQKRYSYWRFFGHFAGRFDLSFIYDHIREHRPDLSVKFFCSGSCVVQMTIRRSKNCVVQFCDSYRLLPESQRNLCEAFGVEHQKGNYDFTKPYCREMVLYNESDCVGLYEVLTSFFEQSGIRSQTFATHALRIFRRDYLTRTLYKPNPTVQEFTRKSYHGGRTEVFKRCGDVSVFDVNSMYPFCMLEPVPVEYKGQSTHLSDNPDYFGFVEADVTWPDVYIPALPVRLEKLYFPSGSFTGIWTNIELIHAMTLGLKIGRIRQGYWFKTDNIFEGYVRKLYEQKKNSSGALRMIAKHLLNSLYGKFGQHPEKSVFCTEIDAPEGALPVLTPDGLPSGYAQYERTSQAAYLLPHIASSITSRARCYLSSSLNENSFYTDTDSVFTSEDMKTGKELGDWGLIGNGVGEFYQAKLYRFGGRWKAKGLNLDEDINSFVNGGTNTVTRHRSIKEAMRSGLPAKATLTITKRMANSRPKRAWDGENETRPWTYGELIK